MRTRGCLPAVGFLVVLVAPASVVLTARDYGALRMLVLAPLHILFICLAIGLVGVALAYGTSGGRRPVAVPALTAAGLFLAGPFLVPWALHDLAGRPVAARVMEAEILLDSETDKDSGRTRYRLADAATERDLGWTEHGPRTRTPAGAVVAFSVVPNGWAEPIARERLDDTDLAHGVTAFAALAAVHVLGCVAAAAAAAWPRAAP